MTHENLRPELDAMIARVEAVQTERKLSDAKLINEYPDLGSAKTWTDRLKPRLWGELKVPAWHAKLKRVCVILDGGSPDDTYHTDAPFHTEMRIRLTQLERQTNDRRVLVCLAPNGTGKSAFIKWAVAQNYSTRAMLRLLPSMRNKPIHIYRGIARALGEDISTGNPAIAEADCIRLLKAFKRTFFFDQAHEGGVALMHIIRAFVDETGSRFGYFAYDTAYRSVMTQSNDAMIEAKAFIGRCMKPAFDLYKEGIRPEDVACHLKHEAALKDDSAKSLAAKITPVLRAHTNLRLLQDAIEAARKADAQDDPTPAMIEQKCFDLSGQDPRKFTPTAEA